MTVALLEEVAADLVAGGLGTLDTDLFLGSFRDDPDEATALFEYPGLPPIDALGPGQPPIERPRIQARCRAASYPTANLRIRKLVARLAAVVDQQLGTPAVRYHRIVQVQNPFLLERDGKRRPVFAVNLQVTKDLSPTTS